MDHRIKEPLTIATESGSRLETNLLSIFIIAKGEADGNL